MVSARHEPVPLAANPRRRLPHCFEALRPNLHLPNGSGLNAAERILSDAPETRIVMLTGNPSQEALGEAANLGVCGFLPKDGSLGVMLDTLRHARVGNMIVHPSLVAGIGGL